MKLNKLLNECTKLLCFMFMFYQQTVTLNFVLFNVLP